MKRFDDIRYRAVGGRGEGRDSSLDDPLDRRRCGKGTGRNTGSLDRPSCGNNGLVQFRSGEEPP